MPIVNSLLSWSLAWTSYISESTWGNVVKWISNWSEGCNHKYSALEWSWWGRNQMETTQRKHNITTIPDKFNIGDGAPDECNRYATSNQGSFPLVKQWWKQGWNRLNQYKAWPFPMAKQWWYSDETGWVYNSPWLIGHLHGADRVPTKNKKREEKEKREKRRKRKKIRDKKREKVRVGGLFVVPTFTF